MTVSNMTVSNITISLRERNRRTAMDQVRSVAFELMSTNGFDAVTVEEIAARSNVCPMATWVLLYSRRGRNDVAMAALARSAAITR